MKKIFIPALSCFLFSASFLQAQISKGSLFLGGNIGLYSSQSHTESGNTKYDQTSFNVSPVIGKGIKENLIFGVNLFYSYTKFKQNLPVSTGTQAVNGYGAGVFLRKYKSIGKGFYIFLEGDLSGRYDKTDNSPLTAFNNYKRTSIILAADPGISYAISKKLHLETEFSQIINVYYSNEKGDKLGSDSLPYKTKTFNFGTSLTNTFLNNVYLGFRLLPG